MNKIEQLQKEFDKVASSTRIEKHEPDTDYHHWLGRRIKVRRNYGRAWFPGQIVKYSKVDHLHTVKFDDGKTEKYNFNYRYNRFKFIKE